ncbi:hypothetical protein HX088_13075 [Empedobacter sp. 225-1]|uniref:hypothetical protein n=1 Tax=unclassified Empedobacter TaxID=2643773 RepID=UPI002578C206|nr:MULTISPECIES: hypothetical protein [unclassified Empedobacter]MDM1524198.1 hypothetical protein [Empedobacter sp. 225-1]MDM1544120.1 hypothetical protein [Empedobacter sp. 189-2]
MKNILFFIFLFSSITSFCQNNEFSTLQKKGIILPYNDDSGVPLITINLDNKAYNFIFDTGSPFTVLNSNRFEIESNSGQKKVKDVNDKINTINKINFNTLSFGKEKSNETDIKKRSLYLSPLEDPLFECNNIDGVLGWDLVSKYIVELNPTKKVIILYPYDVPIFEEYLKTGEYYNLKYNKKGSDLRPLLNVNINNKKQNFLLDSGFNGYISANASDYENLKTTHPFQTFLGYEAIGFFGQTNETLYKSFIIKNTEANFDDNFNLKTNIEIGEKEKNIIGFSFMKQQPIIMSWYKKMILIKKDPNIYLQSSKEKFGIGISYFNNKYIISDIDDNMKDLKLDQQVIKINGTPIENICNYRTYINQQNSLVLTITDENSTFDVKLDLLK